jgi:putative phage-type endonuclease
MPANWACPDAEQVMTVPEMADREKWLEVRRAGIGASEMAILMGEGKYADSTEYDLWLEKTERTPPKEETLAMMSGNLFEDAVARKFAEDAGLTVQRRGTMRSKKEPLVFCNPDRLVDDGNGLEVKVAGYWIWKNSGMKDDPDFIPRHWYWQMVTNIAVTGREGWYLAAMFGSGGETKWETRHLRREACEADIERIWEVAPAWYRERVIEDNPPELGAPEDEAEGERGDKKEFTFPLIAWADFQELRAVRKTIKDLKVREAELVLSFRTELPSRTTGTVRGVPVIRHQLGKGTNTFKKARFVQDYPLIPIDDYYERAPDRHSIVLIGGTE